MNFTADTTAELQELLTEFTRTERNLRRQANPATNHAASADEFGGYIAEIKAELAARGIKA